VKKLLNNLKRQHLCGVRRCCT